MAGILEFIKSSLGTPKPNTAAMARERLQIIIARENSTSQKNFLPQLEKELIEVIRKYIKINEDDIKVTLNKEGGLEILDVNIVIDGEPSEKKEETKTPFPGNPAKAQEKK
jgi:cell division topological specificity factor